MSHLMLDRKDIEFFIKSLERPYALLKSQMRNSVGIHNLGVPIGKAC